MKLWKRILSVIICLTLTTGLIPVEPVRAERKDVEVSTGNGTVYPEIVDEQGDSLDDVEVVGELAELRDERKKVFLLDDGEAATVTYGSDVHYLEADGSWKAIDNRLHKEKDEDGCIKYENMAGRVHFIFADDTAQKNLVQMEQSGTSLSMTLLGNGIKEEVGVNWCEAEVFNIFHDDVKEKTGKPFAEQIEAENIRSSVRYKDVMDKIDLQYIADGSSLKENIWVNAPTGTYSFIFDIRLSNLVYGETEDGKGVLFDPENAKICYMFSDMYMVDAKGNQSDSVECKVLTMDKEGIILQVSADPKWIESPERTFPVCIDPTLESASTSTGDSARIVCNQYVTSGHPNTTHNGYGAGFLGYDSSGDKHYRTFVQFTRLPVLPADSVITQAKFYYAHAAYDPYDMDQIIIAAKAVTSDWNWKTSLTWNNQPSIDNTVLDYRILSASNTSSYIGWNITPLVKAHYEDKENMASAVSSFALVTYDESVMRNTYCAKSWIIQENSAGYYSNAEPLLVIAYRSTRGLENYYTYADQDIGRAGVASIGDYTSQLTLRKNLVESRGRVLPFTLSLVYNSCVSTNFTSNSMLCTRSYSSMRIGKGWKLNIQQTIVEKTIGSTVYYVWTDGDGTEHYFKEESASGIFKDEDGLNLTITKDNDIYTMNDEKDNRKIFPHGYLTEICDANNNRICLLYNGMSYSEQNNWYPQAGVMTNQVTGIVHLTASAPSAPLTLATLGYNSSGYLMSVTDGNGRSTRLNYSSQKITRIIHPDGVTVEYAYSGTDLIRAYDGEKRHGVRYSWEDTTRSGRRVTEVREFAVNDNNLEIDRACFAVDGSDINSTIYRDPGPDGILYNEDDILTTITFDSTGRTVNESSSDLSGKRLYGVCTDEYSDDSDTKRVVADVVTGTQSMNLLKNGGFEDTALVWTKTLRGSDTSKLSVQAGNYQNTGGTRSGAKSLKVAIDADAQPTAGELLGVTLKNRVMLEAGKTYTFSGYVNTTQSSPYDPTSKVYFRIQNPSGSTYVTGKDYVTMTESAIDRGWERLSITFTADVTGSWSVQVLTRRIRGIMYFDDFQVEEGDAASDYNLLVNGDMEWEEGWNLASGSSYCSTKFHNGSKSLQISGDPETVNYAVISIPMEKSSDTTFLLSAWGCAASVPEISRTNCGARFYGLKLEISYEGVSKVEKHRLVFCSDLNGWQYGAQTIVPKKSGRTITNIDIYCIYSLNANTAWFDGVSLREEPVQTYRYNSDGKLIAAGQKDTSTQEFFYEGADLISETSEGSSTFSYDYDNKHNLTKITNDSVELNITVDASGNMTGTSLENNQESYGQNISTSAHTSMDGRYITETENSIGVTTRSSVNAYGWVDHVQVENCAAVDYSFDDYSGYLSAIEQEGACDVSYSYNKGLITSLTRSGISASGDTHASQTYCWNYDLFGNLLDVSIGEYMLKEQEYDPVSGLLTSCTYGSGFSETRITYSYDPLDHLIREDYNGVARYLYTYDCEGNLASKTELDRNGQEKSRIYFEYDSLGKLIRSRVVDAAGMRLQQSEHIYDGEGRIISQTWQVGEEPSRTEEYSYNPADGSLARMQTAMGDVISYSYDALKRPVGQSGTGVTRHYSYRNLEEGRTTTQIESIAYDVGNNPGEFTYNYFYDSIGHLYQVRVNGILTATYQYDSTGQLVDEILHQEDIHNQYHYDDFGNLYRVDKYTCSEQLVESQNFGYGNTQWQDQMTSMNGNPVIYDSTGNPIRWYSAGEMLNLSWEGRQLTGISLGNHSVVYDYNVDGVRGSKIVDGTCHNYMYMGGKVVYDAYDDHILEIIYDSSGLPYGFYYDGAAYRYVVNQYGDVDKILDSQGNVAASYFYNAWGRILDIQDNTTEHIGSINPIRYRGYYYDNETEFYYLGTRYYDPSAMRFLNPDESDILNAGIDSPACKNLYTYCENNPVASKDDTGALSGVMIGIGIAAGCISSVVSLAIDDTIAYMCGREQRWSNWQTYVGAAVGGAVGGFIEGCIVVTTAYDACVAAQVSGFTSSFVTQTLEKFTIPEKADTSMVDIAYSSIVAGTVDSLGTAMIGNLTKGCRERFAKIAPKAASSIKKVFSKMAVKSTIVYHQRMNLLLKKAASSVKDTILWLSIKKSPPLVGYKKWKLSQLSH